jgi:hypothetical protein
LKDENLRAILFLSMAHVNVIQQIQKDFTGEE